MSTGRKKTDLSKKRREVIPPGPSHKPHQSGKSDKLRKSHQLDESQNSGKPHQSDKPHNSGKPDKFHQSDKPHNSDNSSKSHNSGKSHKSGKMDEPHTSDKLHKPQPTIFTLSKKSQEIIKQEMTRYETPRSGLIPALWQIQKEKGWVSKEAVLWLSQETGIPTAAIHELLMFYTMFNKKPVGRFHIQVCANVSCALSGARQMIPKLCQGLNVREGERSTCGNWTVSRVECLGACDEAPVIRLNQEYIGKVKPEKILPFLKSKVGSS